MKCREVIRTRAMDLFEQWLKTWTPNAKKAAVVYGPTGVGKTTTIQCVAEGLGVEVVTYGYEGSSSFEEILARVRTRDWGRPVVVHLDRPYEELGLKGKQLGQIVRNTVNPIVIETEDPKPYKWIGGAEIRVDPPPKAKIAQLLRKRALVKPNFRLVGSDVRQALLLAYGAETYHEENWTEALKECLKNGNCENIDSSHVPALLDSYLEHCYGVECLKAITLLVAADLTEKPHLVVDGFKVGRGISNPSLYFYQRWKAAKEAEK